MASIKQLKWTVSVTAKLQIIRNIDNVSAPTRVFSISLESLASKGRVWQALPYDSFFFFPLPMSSDLSIFGDQSVKEGNSCMRVSTLLILA
jgi:hypothetical protein